MTPSRLTHGRLTGTGTHRRSRPSISVGGVKRGSRDEHDPRWSSRSESPSTTPHRERHPPPYPLLLCPRPTPALLSGITPGTHRTVRHPQTGVSIPLPRFPFPRPHFVLGKTGVTTRGVDYLTATRRSDGVLRLRRPASPPTEEESRDDYVLHRVGRDHR